MPFTLIKPISKTRAFYNKQDIVLRDRFLMQLALVQAQLAGCCSEVPVGAVLVIGQQIWMSFNAPIATHDPTSHAEIRVLRHAALAVKNYRLPNAELFCTLEPCAMCLEAIKQARITRVVYGCNATKWPNVKLNSHKVAANDLSAHCLSVLQNFFKTKRG